jgi:hypothetical protein
MNISARPYCGSKKQNGRQSDIIVDELVSLDAVILKPRVLPSGAKDLAREYFEPTQREATTMIRNSHVFNILPLTTLRTIDLAGRKIPDRLFSIF